MEEINVNDPNWMRQMINIVESKNKTIGILPGRFQPFHQGHLYMYTKLKEQCDEIYIATSGKIQPPKSLLTFAEKKTIMEHSGIPSNSIIQCRVPYVPVEILQNYKENEDRVIFAVSQKDMGSNPRFTFGPKANGKASYYKLHRGDTKMDPFSRHGYVMVFPVHKFKLGNLPISSATEFRNYFSRVNEKLQERMITEMYGSYNPEVHRILKNKIR